MKKVLVLGATGAMGRYLVPELMSLGYAVTAVALDAASPFAANVRYLTGNAFDREFLAELLNEKFDAEPSLATQTSFSRLYPTVSPHQK